ncbi:class I SAM-dependent methyltransferase [Streptomyces fulvoviolaceus]|uniref:class I SAM-dependent methyltransferase n=1 Tax=Streptomyces fulvoviolaceus TaxID=285535 RepID=UPI000693B804|nr:class I SAM-dependent methyltransferase [Streptomyces fulvoviolaceus]
MHAQYEITLPPLQVFQDGTATEESLEFVDQTCDRLDSVAPERRVHLLFLLGFLAHGAQVAGDTVLRERIRSGLDAYLDAFDTDRRTEAGRVTLLYLLAQFPEDRDRILRRVPQGSLPEHEWAQLERCLAELDPADPVLGRAWPTPAGWTLSPEELAADRRWARGLDPERVAFLWAKDTRTLLAYCGARAYAALSGPLDDDTPGTVAVPAGAARPRRRDLPPLATDVGLLRCPVCAGSLRSRAPQVVCRSCAAEFDSTPGYLDLSGVRSAGMDQIAGNSPMYLNTYETLLRPAFLRVTGANWSGGVGVEDEDRYLTEHLRPAPGPVLDLAAGAGRWTETLVRALGPDRVIAMDLATPMVERLRSVLPDVATLRGSAENIPLRDGVLSAVSCWNALQSMSDPARAVKEAGRCLRPGGVFTLLTFVTSTDPVNRFFQSQHEQCLTVRSFPLDELRNMLADAGLTIRDERISGTLIMLTAIRETPSIP